MKSTNVVPKVTIMVINYNGKKWLEQCFRSLAKTSYENTEICLVDNASNDGSLELVRQEFPNVSIIQHDRNYGFAEGYNRAIQMVDADYILLLNNDTQIIDSNWVSVMVNAMQEDNKVAAIACKMLSMENPKLIDSIGGRCYWWTRGFPIGLDEEDNGQYDSPRVEPFNVCAGAALVRRDAFTEVGGFDSAMFAAYEDLDLCWRLRLRGYSISYVPSAVVLHYLSGSWGPRIAAKAYWGPRNFLRSMLKNYSAKSLIKALPNYILYTIVVRMLGYLFWFRMPLAAWATLKAVLWNIANLPDTLRERHKIQSTRMIPDEKIIQAMGSHGREPLYQMLTQANKLIRLHSRRKE